MITSYNPTSRYRSAGHNLDSFRIALAREFAPVFRWL
jgi:hypothetical protein